MSHHTGTATCPHCYTTMTVELEDPMTGCSPEANFPRDEQTPCHADDCTARLCPNCEQFKCASCDLTHCEEHAVKVEATGFMNPNAPEGFGAPPRIEKWCPVCVKEANEQCLDWQAALS